MRAGRAQSRLAGSSQLILGLRSVLELRLEGIEGRLGLGQAAAELLLVLGRDALRRSLERLLGRDNGGDALADGGGLLLTNMPN